MKSLKILLASIISAAFISPTFAEEEIGTVEVTANYVSSCTIPGLPVVSRTGDEAFGSEFRFNIPYQCTIAHDNTKVRFWVERILLYPDEAGQNIQHYLVFHKNFGTTPSNTSTSTDDGAGGPGVPVELTLDKGEYDSVIGIRGIIGHINSPTSTLLRQPVRYESFSHVTPVHAEFIIEGQ